MLKRFWFKFSSLSLSSLNLGCGVTAYDYNDALELLSDKIFIGREMPKIAEVIEDVDVSTLDKNHVIPNMEAPRDQRGMVSQRVSITNSKLREEVRP